MPRLLLLLFASLISLCAYPQQAAFINSTTQKTSIVKPGSKLYLAYKGYRGQQEFTSNIITGITDSSFILGIKPGFFSRKRLPDARVNQYKEVRFADITYFRKRSAGGEVSRDLLRIGSAITSLILLSNLYKSHDISRGNAILISIGTGMVINWSIRLTFPENARYKMDDGWRIQTNYIGR